LGYVENIWESRTCLRWRKVYPYTKTFSLIFVPDIPTILCQ